MERSQHVDVTCPRTGDLSDGGAGHRADGGTCPRTGDLSLLGYERVIDDL